MNAETHQTAGRLILQQQVEGLAEAEREWLDRHLESCDDCAQTAAATTGALGELRGFSVALPPALASRTQLRVYLRSRQQRDRQRTGWAVWSACGVSWAMGIGSAPYVWRAFRWLGLTAGLPDAVWKMGVALWWAAPALAAIGVLLIERGRMEERSDDAGI